MPDSSSMRPSDLKVKPNILVLGVCGIDYVAPLSHFPTPDSKMRSNTLLIDGGGNAGNTACAIGRLEYANVSIVTAVGNDANGRTIIDGLNKNGVDVKYIRTFEGSSPFTYIMTAPDKTRTCIHQPPPDDVEQLTLDFVDSVPLEQYDAIHFDSRHPKAAVHLSKKCMSLGIPYSIDVERPREGLNELLQGATIVMCNSQYCDAILGHLDKEKNDGDIVERLQQVVEMQAPRAEIALTTLGSRGCCLIRPKTKSGNKEAKILLPGDDTIPTVSRFDDGSIWCGSWGGVKVLDTTGAGDAFQGAFITVLWVYRKARGLTTGGTSDDWGDIDDVVLARALRVATRVASKKLEKAGAREGLLFGRDDEFIQEEFGELLSAVAK